METQSTFSAPKWTVSTTLGFIAGVVIILILATLLKMKSEPIILLLIEGFSNIFRILSSKPTKKK